METPPLCSNERFAWLSYACALVSLGVATILCTYFDQFLVEGHLYYLWYILAILFTAWYGGVRPSLFAYILSLFLIAYYFAPPRFDIRIEGLPNQIGFVTFCFLGLVLLFYGSKLEEGKRFNAELERRVEQQLRRRRELESQVLEIAALEQRRIGQELHDVAGQELTALGLLADSLRESQRQGSPVNSITVDRVAEGVKRLHMQIRDVSRGLVPVEIECDGLRSALADLAGQLSETAGVDCSLFWEGPSSVRSDLTATHLFHIAQEACTNAVKHGQARHIKIHVCTAGPIVLEVADDGIGLNSTTRSKASGLGIHIMKTRAGIVQGSLDLLPAKPRGTVVRCTFEEPSHDSDRPGNS